MDVASLDAPGAPPSRPARRLRRVVGSLSVGLVRHVYVCRGDLPGSRRRALRDMGGGTPARGGPGDDPRACARVSEAGGGAFPLADLERKAADHAEGVEAEVAGDRGSVV